MTCAHVLQSTHTIAYIGSAPLAPASTWQSLSLRHFALTIHERGKQRTAATAPPDPLACWMARRHFARFGQNGRCHKAKIPAGWPSPGLQRLGKSASEKQLVCGGTTNPLEGCHGAWSWALVRHRAGQPWEYLSSFEIGATPGVPT